MKRKVIDGGATLDRDVAVAMRDGSRLMVNVFRPADEHQAPVVMSLTPYSKDALPDWVYMTLMRLAGVRFGRLECSQWTGFEAPDPVFWTGAGYVVVQADLRGMHKSERHAGVLTEARWPLDSVRYQPWYLDAARHQLVTEKTPDESAVSYRATSAQSEDRARVIRRFERETELTGSMTLKL